MRAAAVEGLVKLGPADLEPILLAALADHEAAVRSATAEAVFRAATQTGRERLSQRFSRGELVGEPHAPAAADTSADGPPATAAGAPESAWDQWLQKLYRGAYRPACLAATVAPLQTMLAGRQPDERAAAAQALAPLGRAAEAVPVILDAVRADAKLFGEAHAILPWLVSAERRRVFQRLRPLATTNDQLAGMIESFAEAAVVSESEMLWKMLADETPPRPPVASLIESLLKIHLGQRMYGGG